MVMELAEPSAPGAIRLASGAPAERVSHLASDRHRAARADLDRMPMTAHSAAAPDDELGRSRKTLALPHRRLRPLAGGLSTGTAMSSTNKS